MSISPRGIGLLAVIALTALILPGPIAIAAFVLALVAVVTDAWLVRLPPEVRVVTPPIISRGVPAGYQASIQRPVGVRLRQAGTPDVRVEPDTGVGGLRAEITALRRGAHTLPRPATLSEGPLGLGRWHHRAGTESTVIVYPDMPAARRIATEVRLGKLGDSARRSRGPLGLGTELEAIRDYLPDDDIRQVNWRATARLGTPMSNTYRIEQEREVTILVDSGRLMAAPVGDGTDRTRLDVAVDAAAALAAVADVVGDRVGVIAFDDRIRRRLSPRRDGGDAVVTAIHDLEPRPVESDFELAFRTVAHDKRAFVLILTDLMEETAARPLVEAMPILARHHAVSVAGVSDPAVVAALATPAAHVSEAFVTAAAIDVERSRRRAASKLAGFGAMVIDVPAESLPRRCVEAYLRAKRAARL